MTTWYFWLDHNSQTPPCGGSNCTHVDYAIDSQPRRSYGGYSDQSDTEIMNYLFALPVSYDSSSGMIYYSINDIVYVNDVLWGANTTATDYIDVLIKPHSWYTQESATAELITKVNDIAGAVFNVFTQYGLTQYTYINTEFINSDSNIIMRVNLRAV